MHTVRLFDRVVRDFESTTVPMPLRIAPNRQPETFVHSVPVLVFETHADADFQSGPPIPLNGVRIVSNVGSELSAIVLIPPVAGGTRIVLRIVEKFEEGSPRSIVHASNLL